MVRIGSQQRVDQRCGGARLTHRNGVQPEQRPLPGRQRRIEAMALAKMLHIRRLAAGAPEQPQPDQRQRKVEEQRIGEKGQTRHQRSACSATLSTSAADGGAPLRPRLRTKPLP
jgi:hypothetical protein